MKAVKGIGVLIVLAVVAISTMAVFVSTVAADEEEEDPFMIYGYITDAEGNPLQGYEVIIKKQHNLLGKEVWRELKGLSGYMNITNESGYYSTGWCFPLLQGYGVPWDNYSMYINGELVDKRYIGIKDWEKSGRCIFWKYQWSYEIPEFTTIAVPIAAIFGLILLFNHRKRRK
ncbi:MAG: hypothetical protein OCU16_07210 [Candidatus Methanospirare jalkutatii]|nr:hypothetical protein [Candidatus Methanospirare jalkutatii]